MFKNFFRRRAAVAAPEPVAAAPRVEIAMIHPEWFIVQIIGENGVEEVRRAYNAVEAVELAANVAAQREGYTLLLAARSWELQALRDLRLLRAFRAADSTGLPLRRIPSRERRSAQRLLTMRCRESARGPSCHSPTKPERAGSRATLLSGRSLILIVRRIKLPAVASVDEF